MRLARKRTSKSNLGCKVACNLATSHLQMHRSQCHSRRQMTTAIKHGLSLRSLFGKILSASTIVAFFNAGEAMLTEGMTEFADVKVTVTAHPASPVSLSPNDLLEHSDGRQLSPIQLAEASHEWRVMRFNGITRQSVCRVVASSGQTEVLPVPACIATEYLKSMIAAGALSRLLSYMLSIMTSCHGSHHAQGRYAASKWSSRTVLGRLLSLEQSVACLATHIIMMGMALQDASGLDADEAACTLQLGSMSVSVCKFLTASLSDAVSCIWDLAITYLGLHRHCIA